jgi:mono/diheme cytochrome c family protein
MLGRLHVVFVHFPIALLLVAALVEAWRIVRRTPGASPTAVVCLAIGAASAVLAAVMGWYHKQSLPDSRSLTAHQWLGMATAAVAILPLMLVGFQRWPKALVGYRAAVMLCAVLTGITGHLGGALTHGDGYLTELFWEAEKSTDLASAPPTAAPVIKLADVRFPADGRIDFTSHVEPIFAATCYECHGPAKVRGGLRLDSHARLLKGGNTGPTVIPGKSADSTLLLRIKGVGTEKQMPLDHPPLTDEQVKILATWVDQGAKWAGQQTSAVAASPTPVDEDQQDHWAYNKPKRPTTAPVQNAAWVKNPIDNFVLAKLEKENIKPSPEADRVTLIRRLSFDLTGLPPKPADVDAFLADQSPDAYEKVVDRLLASPHHGERMAVYWLDLVRFGDTLGIHNDTTKPVTPYRDWVINAINDNKPFDQFTIEQLAGDLLPNPTLQQRVASAYNRLLITSEEGGAQPKEYIVKYAADRVRNVTTTWLGATVGCAECHNHKFDPYSQKDFYRLAAFFADVQDNAVGAHRPVGIIPVPDAAQQAQVAKLDDSIAKLRAKLNVTTPELEAAQDKWEKLARRAIPWTHLEPATVTPEAKDAVLLPLPDKSILAGGPRPAKDTYTFSTPLPDGKKITAIRIEVLPDISFPMQGPGRFDNGNFALTGLSLTVTPPAGGSPAPVALRNITTTHAQEQWPATELADGKHHNPGGWAILPEAGKPNSLVFETAADLAGPGTLNLRLEQQLGDGHTIGRFRVSFTDAPRPVGVAKFSDEVKRFLDVPKKKRNNKQRDTLLAYYRSIAPELDPVRHELAKLEKSRADILASARQCEVAVAAEPRVTRVLARGNWLDETGEIVTPAVPRFLKQLDVPEGQRPTRLDLARWLVSTDNPLTARVHVNRLWKMFFGTGLSKTLEDMGTQGERPPVHPELLAWLATEFMQSGWDQKHLVRLMVTSNAYRQSSTGPKGLHDKDPFNRLLARQSPFRLEGEFIRDNALAVAGLLNTSQIGGDSVRPYQPDGYWEFLNFPKRTYEHDKSADSRNRRTLYQWWQRTFLHPSLLNFDVPNREECVANRTLSNTPLQALDLLNNPTFVEAARLFAQRVLTEGGSNDVDRLTFAFRACLSRPPLPAERQVMTDLLAKHLKQYAADPASASLVLTNGAVRPAKDLNPAELAAWTSVTRAILNLHETITRM